MKEVFQNQNSMMPSILTIGKLQILRRMITKQIHFAARVECTQYENCLSTFNQSVIANLQEIRENAIQSAAMREDDIEFNEKPIGGKMFGQANLQKQEREIEA